MSVGPDFEWRCPVCGRPCADENPVVVDRLMVSIVEAHQPSEQAKGFFQVTSDGEICDDSLSESSDVEGFEETYEVASP